jgi:acyl carrier protein
MADRERTREALVRFLGTISRAGQTLDGVGDDVNLVDAGIIDSLAMVQIIVHLEQAHAIDLLASGIDPAELSTIGGILRSIERAGK